MREFAQMSLPLSIRLSIILGRCILENILLLKQDDTDRQFVYWIRHIPEPQYGYFPSAVYPDNGWNADEKVFRPPSRDTGKVGAFQFQNKTGDGFVVMIRRDGFERWCTVIPISSKGAVLRPVFDSCKSWESWDRDARRGSNFVKVMHEITVTASVDTKEVQGQTMCIVDILISY